MAIQCDAKPTIECARSPAFYLLSYLRTMLRMTPINVRPTLPPHPEEPWREAEVKVALPRIALLCGDPFARQGWQAGRVQG